MPARNGKWYGSKWIREVKRLAIYLRDNFRCLYCKKDLRHVARKLRTLDHIVPVALGGTNDATNLATCCKRCNDGKGDTPLAQWKPAMLVAVLEQAAKPLPMTLAREIIAGIISDY
jgi:hypothetical protein